ncbi:MAG TPA: BtpA/SgcQ family protein [Candidatus Krumholzibacteria bacterium]|nr:BtpA/SgcQ family protein [Candidatus Krumholzibacteria bacterium]
MKTPTPPLSRAEFREQLSPPLWGMIHLLPLPGASSYDGNPDSALERALRDAEILAKSGFKALMVENFGDAPFFGSRVPPITVAAMTRVVERLRQEWPELKLGVNCLRNDAKSALSIACATGAWGIRVNVHLGAMLTDQGILKGGAARTLRLRREFGVSTHVLADLRVKHAASLAPRPLAEEALELRERGRADCVLVTGGGTGFPADPALAEELREVLPDAPILVASGVNPKNAAFWSKRVDGAIVGSALMHGGRAGAGVDPKSARGFLEAWSSAS